MGGRTVAIFKSGDCQQGTQPVIAYLTQTGQAALHDDAIFANERDDIGDGRDGNGFQQGIEQSRLPGAR